MKSRIGDIFLAGFFGVCLIGADLIATHLMLPSEKLNSVMTQETYRLLIAKWFVAGLVLGLLMTFFLIEAWIWKNWKSWNRFCCEHHERVYQAQMGISQGRMLRR